MTRPVVFSLLLLFLIGDVAGGQNQQSTELRIELAQDSEREKETANLLSALVKSYDLSAWVFTHAVTIEEGVIPHSHPVLTLNTRHLGDRDQLLALFLHEQIHWFLAAPDNEMAIENATTELRKKFPAPPSSQYGGAANERSTYLHLILNWLEFEALSQILGVDTAISVLERKDVYEWIYKTVRERHSEIESVVDRHKLTIANGHH
jgi:hypothetical protein